MLLHKRRQLAEHALRTPGGGSSIQRFVLVEGADVHSRPPTPRECARLMGLPETYMLPGSKQDAYRLTGDGVAAPVVRWLATHLLESILEGAASSNTIVAMS